MLPGDGVAPGCEALDEELDVKHFARAARGLA